MYLSLITPQTGRINPVDADENHEAVWKFFPGHNRDDRVFIYSAAMNGNSYCVVSKELPVDTTGNFNIKYKPYDIGPFVYGEKFGYKVLLNSTIRKNKKDHDVVENSLHELRAENVPLSSWPTSREIYQKSLLDWFKKRGINFGFEIAEDLWIESQVRMPAKNIEFVARQITGTLTVIDPIKFKESLYKGIGDRKDRGCGLLMVWGL